MKIPIKIYCIVFLVSIIPIFNSCKKTNSNTNNTIIEYWKFPLESLKYVQLTPGKYLIYKDSATGELDSVVVTSCILVTRSGTISSPDIRHDFFSLTLKKYNTITPEQWFYGEADAWPYSGNSPDRYQMVLFESYVANGIGYETQAFAYPYSHVYLGELIPSLLVEGKNYTDVLKFRAVYSTLLPRGMLFKTNYWAKGAGIIRREIKIKGTADSVAKTYTLLRNN